MSKWMPLPDPYKEVESTTKGVLKGIRAEITNLVKTYPFTNKTKGK